MFLFVSKISSFDEILTHKLFQRRISVLEYILSCQTEQPKPEHKYDSKDVFL